MRYQRDGFSVDSAIKKGRALPDWYLDQPEIVAGSEFFHTAYRDLATCRHPDGSIPWLAAMAYADRKRLRPDLANALWEAIWRMDVVERRWRLDEIRRESGGGD